MADNPLYPTDSFEDRWGGLPVEAPRFNYTPNSSLIESEPRKEPFKLTPVNFNPFPENSDKYNVAPESLREVFSGYDKPVGRQQIFPERLARFVGKTAVAIPGALIRGATNPRAAFRGEFAVSDPETGMPTEETVGRALETAAWGGPGGLVSGAEQAIPGVGLESAKIFGKKLVSDTSEPAKILAANNPAYKFTPVEASTVSDAFKNRFLPNGVPKPEAFDRVLPAVRNLDTGKISTTKRGNEHATILDRLWEKQGGDPGISTLELYENMLPKHEMGFYDPKNKQFFPRSHPDWQNIDSPDLNPKEAMKSGQTFYEDSSKPAQMLSALRNNEGYRNWDAAANKAGFTTDAYHGGVTRFRGEKIYRSEFYAADDPKLAQDYSTLGLSLDEAAKNTNFNSHILPLKLNTSDYHVVDAKGKQWDQVNRNAIQEAKNLGKSGVTIHNVKDPINETSPFQEPSTIHIALDPSTVRSRFAKFNPEDIKKNGLLLSDTQKPAQILSATRNRFESKANELKQWLNSDKADYTPDSLFAEHRKAQHEYLNTEEGGIKRVLPALKDEETGKLVIGKRTDNHPDLQIERGDKSKKYDYGYYDPRTKQFHSRNDELSPYFAVDTTDLKPGKFAEFRSDTQKPGMAMAALHDAPTFYSAVEHAVNNGPKQALPNEWLGPRTERNYVNKDKTTGKETPVKEVKYSGIIGNMKGVKPEELEWIGLPEWLQEKANRPGANRVEPITKQEIQDFVNQNKVELKEVGKGAIGDKVAVTPNGEHFELSELENPVVKKTLDKVGYTIQDRTPTKYSQYQLPGGENYREKLLTLPFKMKQSFEEWSKERGYGDHPGSRNLYEKYVNGEATEPEQGYRSSHWDEPNVLAHVRMNDRNIEGKKSLHIEEIQSDWHQAGRDKGYKITSEQEKRIEELRQKLYNRPEGMKKGESNLTASEQEEWNKLHEAKESSIPNAPFKKTWHELVLKRMIREAAEKGYDRISWTPGEAQAARYDLSKQVDAITTERKANGTYTVTAKPKNADRYESVGEEIPANKLADHVGKEMAEKIIKKHETFGNKGVNWQGIDLKVGGEGMKGFYDKMIPNAIEKIGKEHGVKVKQAEIDASKRDAMDRLVGSKIKQQVHYIDIPESLKNVAMKKGFPLFSGGHVFTPIAGNPHETVNHSNDVPYGAGASNTPSGYPVNIDKRIPKYDERLKTSDGRRADLHKYLTIHEINEYKAMKAGMPYEKAHHEIATKAEKAAVEADGVNWSEYEHVIDGYLKETEHENPKDPPSNLYKKPYAHDKKELNKMRNK